MNNHFMKELFMKKFFLITLLFCFPVFSENEKIEEVSKVVAQGVSITDESDLNKLIELSFDRNNLSKMLTASLDHVFSMYSIIGSKEDIVNELVRKLNDKETTDKYKTIWKKYFSNEEITELVKYYETPLGKKILKIMPEIIIESSQLSSKISQGVISKYLNINTSCEAASCTERPAVK